MAQPTYTPIQLYYSTTAAAVPTAANLAQGELAINITDGKLYYEDNGGAVQVIATKGAGTIGGSTTQIQYNNAGALAGNAAMVFNNSTNVVTLTTLNLTNALGAIYGGTGQSTYTTGDLLYSSASNTLAKLAIGTANYILTVNSGGTNVQWSAPSSISVSTATNLAGGVAGSVPYQSGASTTTFLGIGAADRVMTSSGTAPQWVTALTGLTGVSSSSITNTGLTSGRVVYSGTGGLQTNSANLTFDGTTLTTAGLSNSGTSGLVKLVTVGNTSFNGSSIFAAATPAKLYMGTGTVTDVTSAINATNTTGAIASLDITPIAASNTGVTYTNASTLYIAGAPSVGTNISITNPYALYVAAGASYLGGNTAITGTLSATGVATFSAGSAALPAITTTGDTNTGIWFPAADTIAFTEGGVESMRIDSSGNLLVGTTTNASGTPKVAVNGSIQTLWGQFRVATVFDNSFRQGLYFDSTARNMTIFSTTSDSGGNILFSTRNTVGSSDADYGTERMRIDSSGNLGVGTSSPSQKLTVVGNILTASAAGTDSYINISTNGVQNTYLGFNNSGSTNANGVLNNFSYVGNGNSYGLQILTSGSVAATIDASGNLGLGVTPSAWYAGGFKAFQINNGFNAFANAASFRLMSDAYLNTSAVYVRVTGAATASYEQSAGVHSWRNAPAGTALSTFSDFTTAMTLDASGRLGIGNTSPTEKLSVNGPGMFTGQLANLNANSFSIDVQSSPLTARLTAVGADGSTYLPMIFAVCTTTTYAERMRIDTSGNLLVGKTAVNATDGGFLFTAGAGTDQSFIATNIRSDGGGEPIVVNRQGSDGTLIDLRQANTSEGTISVSGTTVSYNGGHLSRWAQTTAPKDDTLVKGTVLSNLDAMNVYTDADGVPVANEQLNKVKVSDVEGDANVAGVFVNWTHDEAHNVDEINMAMTGDMIIRIAQGVTVARGDLLMSAGNGTAKPQGDDIVRSKTVAKVTSTHVTCTYEDGSYCVPCVLMAC